MVCVLNSARVEYYTESVLKWLRTDTDTVNEYLDDVIEKGTKPNYTDLLKYVSGTTVENVNLASIYVKRSKCTEYLLSEYLRRNVKDGE